MFTICFSDNSQKNINYKNIEDKLVSLQESGNKEEEELEERCKWFKEKNILLVKEVASYNSAREGERSSKAIDAYHKWNGD